MKNFENFTNLYELSKTLRFEIKPIWDTKRLLEENHIIELDKARKMAYERVKPYFNTLHRDFIAFALKDEKISYEEYYSAYQHWTKNKKDKNLKKEKENAEKHTREEISKLFDKKAKRFLQDFPEIKFKKHDKDFLYEIGVFVLLKEKFKDDKNTEIMIPETGEIINIFDGWNRWLGYFTKFFNTRRNFYKDDGTSTAVATRLINDNLKIFADNIEIFEKISEKNIFEEVEKNFGIELKTLFEKNFYNSCFLQEGIDFYNKIIGGETREGANKVEWLNEFINKYRQKTGEKTPFFKKLQKQILSEKSGKFIDQIENESELREILQKFFENSNRRAGYIQKMYAELSEKNDENYSKIYLNKTGFNTLSHKFTENVAEFEKLVFDALLQEKIVQKSDFDKKEEKYKFPDFIPLLSLKKALENYTSENLFWKERYYLSDGNSSGILQRKNGNLWQEFLKILNFELEQVFSREIITENDKKTSIWYEISKQKLGKLLEKTTEKFSQNEKALIKDFADSSKILYSFWKFFALEKRVEWDNNYELDNDFYAWENWYLENFYNDGYEEIVKSYNLMRNYISKKPWSDTQKWKINFENSSLLGGWDKEFDSNGAYIFRKKGLYYLGIINGSKPNQADVENLYKNGNETIERFVYDFQKPDNKNIPRTFIRSKQDSFAPAVEKYNLPIGDILEIYDQGLFKTENRGNPSYKPSLTKLIDYFKLWLSKHESYKHYNFLWKKSDEYENISEFYRDAEKSCYKPSFEKINYSELLRLVENGKMYLFQIYNKDFELDQSLQKEGYNFKVDGKKNVHTMYFESLFHNHNMQNPNGAVMKLSGGGEIFFRPKSIDATQEKRKFSREITAHKRYTEDKMFLHFPLQINFKQDIWMSFNENLNNFLAHNPDINIIGIDRGEKHLAYFSVINQQWVILESGSLNYIQEFDNEKNPVKKMEKIIDEQKDSENNTLQYILKETGKEVNYIDYANLLEVKEKNRKLQRQSWKEVEQIKDLKKWYISILVKKLADLIIQYNAIVVFEDLNMRFKQIRGWIEKSVYQQLEKALIDKLNFLVNKNEINPEKAGNVLKAYQLTAPVEAFKDMWKQTGIIFYTEASYTSKIDPLTGWRPNLYLKKQNAEKNKEHILQLSSIIFNKEKNRFEFAYDLKNFFGENSKFPKKTKWTLCSSVERFRWNRNLNNNKWWYIHFTNLTDGEAKFQNKKWENILHQKDFTNSVNFKELFEKFKIDIFGDILAQIRDLEIKGNEKFFADFIELFTLLCQIRNTNIAKSGDENDFILSPVEPFFDSRMSSNLGKSLPKNGDENGAYNIARKWIIILERINDWAEQTKEKYPDLYISREHWDNFITKNTENL